MGKQIPDDWTTLNVKSAFNLRGSYPSDLRIYRKKKSPYIYAAFLPEEKDDPRPDGGRTKGGKRRIIDASMGVDDPLAAAKSAIAWVNQKQKALEVQKDEDAGKYENTLSDYWDVYFAKESRIRESRRNFNRWRREEQLKWSAEEYGIKNQAWSKIAVNLIRRSDFEEYFALLERRARKANGGNGSGMKGQQKTLINKLFAIAESDFVGHKFASYPPISKQKKQVRHFTWDEWQILQRHIFELGEGKEAIAYTPNKYKKLDWSSSNRQNTRNWVDLWDAIQLEWYFYLRSEDMYRLKSEWFKKVGKDWVCDLETTKKDRPIHRTTHYRKDAVKFMKRITSRKPNGYLILPHISRPINNPADSSVLLTLNFLLKKAIEGCLPKVPKESMKWTTIRHTAFRLTLEEMPSLGVAPKINAFADNGHTSPQQLRDTYLRWIDSDKTAREAREQIAESQQVRWGGKYGSKQDIENS